MQLTEVSMTGVRSAVITLRRAETPMRFVLFPMLHLGSPGFYREVTHRLALYQVVVAEGIRGRSLIASALTISYRMPGRRQDLIAQRIDYRSLPGEIVAPDMTGGQLRQGWRSLPWLQRAGTLLIAPVMGVVLWMFGARRMLSRYAAVEDVPDQGMSQLRVSAAELTELLVDQRDALLAEALDAIHQQRCHDPIDVAVVYGAEHMPGTARYLLARHGYRPREAEWLTVLEF